MLRGLTMQENSEAEKQLTPDYDEGLLRHPISGSFLECQSLANTQILLVVGEFLPSSKGPIPVVTQAHTYMTVYIYAETCTNMYTELRPYMRTHMHVQTEYTHVGAHTWVCTHMHNYIPDSYPSLWGTPCWSLPHRGRGEEVSRGEIRKSAKAEWAHGSW